MENNNLRARASVPLLPEEGGLFIGKQDSFSMEGKMNSRDAHSSAVNHQKCLATWFKRF